MMGMAVVMQGLSMCLAAYFITQTIDRNGDELAEQRPEHLAVAALTQSEQAFNQRFKDVTNWNTLNTAQKAVILTAVICLEGATFIFLCMDEMCFRSFKVNDSIDAPEHNGGLDGNPLHIVKPIGAVGLVFFAVGFTIHTAFVQHVTYLTEKSMIEAPAEESAVSGAGTGQATTGELASTYSFEEGLRQKSSVKNAISSSGSTLDSPASPA